MFVEIVKNNGKDYLRLARSRRQLNKNGDRVSKKEIVFNIGPLDRYDDGKPDYYERLKKSFREGDPLIESLRIYCNEENAREETYQLDFTRGTHTCIGHPRLLSHVLLEKILEELGLHYLISNCKRSEKIKYDVYGFFKLLIFGRFLNPASEYAALRQNDDYYIPMLKNFNPDNVYDALDFIEENEDKIVRRINTNLIKKADRSLNTVYYDVTNLYCETDYPDEVMPDDEGKLPVVQTGLFMDDKGIPISVEIFPDNTLDHLTLRSALKKNIDGLDSSHFILIADRGICNYTNLLHILESGNGYIVSQSLSRTLKTERDWTCSDEGYIWVGKDYKYKSRIIERTAKDENGKPHVFKEKVIVCWSRKYQEREENENKTFLDFLKKLEENPADFRITAIQYRSLKKFFKKECIDVKSGEILDSRNIKPLLDFDKVKEYRKSMGYYQIITSELTMDDREIIDKYHSFTQIEDQFRVMKSTLNAGPFFVRTSTHVKAHLLISMTALILLRIIQIKIIQSGLIDADPDAYWSSGLSAERIQRAMNKWTVEILSDELYRINDAEDEDLKLILDAFGIKIEEDLYQRGDLKRIKTDLKIFT